jgi:hypothetical protein
VVYLAIVGLTVVIALVALVFILGSRATAQAHVCFTAADVEEALTQVISPDAASHNVWDVFLSWPIDDPYFESIRQRCLDIVKNDEPPPGRDLSYGAERQIKALLVELRSRPHG